MKIKLLTLAAFIFLTSLSVFAQQPEQINIKSLQVSLIPPSEAEAVLNFEKSSGNPVIFEGWTAYGLSFLRTDIRIPSVLDTNGFTNYGVASSAPGGNGDYRFRFYLTSSESEPIVLRPTSLRKKREMVFTGATTVRGRIEVIDQRNLPSKVIAVDNDIVLTGRYRAVFTQSSAGSVRSVQFKNISYNLTQTQ